MNRQGGVRGVLGWGALVAREASKVSRGVGVRAVARDQGESILPVGACYLQGMGLLSPGKLQHKVFKLPSWVGGSKHKAL